MANPFKTVLDAFKSEEPVNNKEIEEAKEAGEKAAEIGAKNAKKEQNTKSGEGR